MCDSVFISGDDHRTGDAINEAFATRYRQAGEKPACDYSQNQAEGKQHKYKKPRREWMIVDDH